MANAVTFQLITDGPRNATYKMTGILDTSDFALADVLTMAQLGFAPNTVLIDHIDYSISDQLEVQLLWGGTPDQLILPLAGRGRMSFIDFGGLKNNATTPTGSIRMKTTGWTSGTQIFSIVLELVKQGGK